MHIRLRKIRLLRRLRKQAALRRLKRDDRGTQLVELAIVIPLFILLLGATAEFGRYFYEYTTLTKAARLGTRYLATAAVKTTEDTAAKNIVVFGNAAGTGSPILSGLSASNITITRTGGVALLPETVTVTITGFKHQPIFDLGKLTKSPSLSMNIDVKPSATMRYLLTQPAL